MVNGIECMILKIVESAYRVNKKGKDNIFVELKSDSLTVTRFNGGLKFNVPNDEFRTTINLDDKDTLKNLFKIYIFIKDFYINNWEEEEDD